MEVLYIKVDWPLLALIAFLLSITACSKKDNGTSSSKNIVDGCLGYTLDPNVYGTPDAPGVYDFKNAQNNAFFSGEVDVQRSFWNQIPAQVCVIHEPGSSVNAYGTTDGYIYFGYNMFYFLVQRLSQVSSNYASPLPIDGVLAHEWGHRVQFTVGWNDYQSNMEKELEADFFSGYYMGLAKQWYWSQIQTYYNTMYSFGDNDFSSPQHHGTPQQRLNSAYAGLQVAVYALNNKTQYTYDQLHGIFNQNLNTILSSNATAMTPSDKQLFEEVSYPKTLNKASVEKLFPVNKKISQ